MASLPAIMGLEIRGLLQVGEQPRERPDGASAGLLTETVQALHVVGVGRCGAPWSRMLVSDQWDCLGGTKVIGGIMTECKELDSMTRPWTRTHHLVATLGHTL